MTLAERLSAALAATAPDTVLLTGDLNDDERIAGTLTPAAVLIAITDRPRPGVILTQRTTTLSRHAGQVAFPGGRIDPTDADATAAALREAEEEIALPPGSVDVVAALDPYRTGTNFVVTPVIGVVPPDMPLVPAEAEVAAVFETPLDFLIDEANHVRAAAEWQGRLRHYYEIGWQDRRIWGATAAMLVNLSRRLRWTP